MPQTLPLSIAHTRSLERGPWLPGETDLAGAHPLGQFRGTCVEPASIHRPSSPDSFDVLHYDIHVHGIDEEAAFVKASTIVTLEALTALDRLDLDFASQGIVSVEIRRAGAEAFETIEFLHADNRIRVGPFATLAPNARMDVRVAYEGDKTECTSAMGLPSGIQFTRVGVHTFSEPTYARHWYPCHDTPWDKATFSITLDVPDSSQGFSIGDLVSEEAIEGGRRLTWEVDEPFSTYLAAFYMGDYVSFDTTSVGVPIQHNVFPDLLDKAKVDFENLPDMMAFFSTIYGPYPYDRYAQTLGWFGGGMEHVTNSLIGVFFMTGTKRFENIFAHELAHQWWGDLVTMDSWNDIWLNEGFATYSEVLYKEHQHGFEAAKRQIAALDTVVFTFQDTLGHPVVEPPRERIFSFMVYNKGARVLHMLRGLARLFRMQGPPSPPEAWASEAMEGDRLFFDIFPRHRSVHAYGNATSASFQRVAEEVLGRDLEWFFGPWLEGEGNPRIEFDWAMLPSDPTSRVAVRLRQIQSVPPFTMPLQVRYRSDDGRILDEVRNLDARELEWTVDLPQGSWSVELDPDDWLMDESVRVPLISTLVSLAAYPNPSANEFTLSGELAGEAAERGALTVFDPLGRLVAREDLGLLGPGAFQARWEPRTREGRRVAGGVYFARVDIGFQSEMRRLVVLP